MLSANISTACAQANSLSQRIPGSDSILHHVPHCLSRLRREPWHRQAFCSSYIRFALTAAISGLGLVKALAARADTMVFAGTRNLSSATELNELAKQQKNVHVLKLTSGDAADNQAAAAEIKKVAGALHVVIANAGECVLSHQEQSRKDDIAPGMMNQMAWGVDTSPQSMAQHFDVSTSPCTRQLSLKRPQVNVNGPLVLFQATYPLLKASTPTPKFIGISSVSGSIEIGAAMPLKGLAYGASKAALNFVMRKLHHENDGLSACPC
jgi:NAD(P)-dependent dehydrogenase (short-subunit alcohol dehydrogenase family)